MNTFNNDNTRGYTQEELDILNETWEEIEKIIMREYKEESVTCLTLECYIKNRKDRLCYKFDSGERGQQLIDSVIGSMYQAKDNE